MEERLDRLRGARTEEWKELADTLGITVVMLHYLRKGARNPSPKLLRRIMELETDAGLSPPSNTRLMVRETGPEYVTTRDRKHIDIVEARRQVVELERQLSLLKKTLEDADHE